MQGKQSDSNLSLNEILVRFKTRESGLNRIEISTRTSRLLFPSRFLTIDYIVLTQALLSLFVLLWLRLWNILFFFAIFWILILFFRLKFEKKLKEYPVILRELLSAHKVKVYRENQVQSLGWDKLVSGDIIELNKADITFTNIFLIDGTKLVVENPFGSSNLQEKYPLTQDSEYEKVIVEPACRIVEGKCKGIVEYAPCEYLLKSIEERGKFERVKYIENLAISATIGSFILFFVLFFTGGVNKAFWIVLTLSPIYFYIIYLTSISNCIKKIKSSGFVATSVDSFIALSELENFFFEPKSNLIKQEKRVCHFFVDDELIDVSSDYELSCRCQGLEPHKESLGLLLKIGALVGGSYSLSKYETFDNEFRAIAERLGIKHEELLEKEFEFQAMIITPEIKGGFFTTKNGEKLFLAYGEPQQILEASAFYFSHSVVMPITKSNFNRILEIANDISENKNNDVFAYAYKFIKGFEEGINYFNSLVFVGLTAFEHKFIDQLSTIRKGFENLGIRPKIIIQSEESKFQDTLKNLGWIRSISEIMTFDLTIQKETFSANLISTSVIIVNQADEFLYYISENLGKRAAYLLTSEQAPAAKEFRGLKIGNIPTKANQKYDILFDKHTKTSNEFLKFIEYSCETKEKLEIAAILTSWILFGQAISLILSLLFYGFSAFLSFPFKHIVFIDLALVLNVFILCWHHKSCNKTRIRRLPYIIYGCFVFGTLNFIWTLLLKDNLNLDIWGNIFLFSFFASVFSASSLKEPFMRPKLTNKKTIIFIILFSTLLFILFVQPTSNIQEKLNLYFLCFLGAFVYYIFLELSKILPGFRKGTL